MRLSKIFSSVAGISLLALSLTGCATNASPTGTNGKMMAPNMDHGSMHTMAITDKQSFAEAMIPHHQQAIDMSNYAITNTSNPEVLAIAEKISSEQGPEIDKMTPWLAGKSVDYSMMMTGMISPMQLATLQVSKDGDFDKLFIQFMIQHHDGAVSMAGEAIGVNDPELTDFANEIIRTQSAEIEELMALQNK
ncbi:MAG: DUF305 domain-containing protein [Micrococcales bacterium]|nr:DUF305 domain-containing protein [Actinomycetota bacterium]NCA08047.1 DUF305 domain-containing protein [Micrococcales bacterium]